MKYTSEYLEIWKADIKYSERLLIYGEKLKKPKMLEETFLRENSFGFLIQMIELDNKFNCFFFFLVESSILLTDIALKQLQSLTGRKSEAE